MKAEDEYTHKSRSIFVCESNDDTDDDVTDDDDSDAYFIFVISFTQTGFSKTKFYTQKNS